MSEVYPYQQQHQFFIPDNNNCCSPPAPARISSVLCNLVFMVSVATALGILGMTYYSGDFLIIFFLAVFLCITYLAFVLLTSSIILSKT